MTENKDREDQQGPQRMWCQQGGNQTLGEVQEGVGETAAAENPQAGGKRETKYNLEKGLDQIFLLLFRRGRLGYI